VQYVPAQCWVCLSFQEASLLRALLRLGGVVEGVACAKVAVSCRIRRFDSSSCLVLSSSLFTLGDHVVQYSQLAALVSLCPPMLTPPRRKINAFSRFGARAIGMSVGSSTPGFGVGA
jgi:hypothetical protein